MLEVNDTNTIEGMIQKALTEFSRKITSIENFEGLKLDFQSAIKELKEGFEAIKSSLNDNSTTISARFEVIEKALQTLDSDFKAVQQKKKFSLGFVSFDFEE